MAGQERDTVRHGGDGEVVRDLATISEVRTGSELASEGVDQSIRLPVLEEQLVVSKRRVKTGTVKVSTRTETHEDVAELSQERTTVEVTRVPIDRVVDQVPDVRTEGDTTIVPVFEERLVVVKQLVLIEELHIRRRTEHEVTHTPVTLRRQHVDIERLDADHPSFVPTPGNEE